jgi:hypothetical protein
VARARSGFASLAIIAAVLCTGRGARADGVYVDPDRLRHFAVDGDPFALLPGELWADLEWLPVVHHAIVLSPFALYYDSTITPFAAGDTRTQTGFGAQFEYRVYSGSRGANGFFVGGGGVLGHTSTTAGTSIDGQAFPAESYAYAGGQIDAGVQGMFDSGFLIGGGGNVQVTERLEAGARPAVSPRILFTLGYAF